jgi:bile acid:Na+ symporter, BASS family
VTTTQLVTLAIQVSMATIVFCVALHARLHDVVSLLRRPRLLARSLLAMNVIMPVIAAIVAAVFDFRRTVEIAFIALAVSPVPPILPTKEYKAGGAPSYVLGLLAISALVSVVFVPVALDVLGRVFARPAHVPMGAVAWIVATSVLAPLGAGILVRRLAPSVASKVARPLSIAGTLLLVVAFLPVLVKMWPALIAQLGDFTLLAIVVFVLAGLAVGHLLGGPNPDERTVLALSTATRHPGMAIAIAQANAPVDHSVAAAILLVFLVGAIVSVPYVKWRAHRHARGGVR